MLHEKQWVEWKKKRRTTFIGFLLVGVMVGIDYSIIFSTLYLYLKNTIKIDRCEMFYGITIAGYMISSSCFGLLTGRWLDKTRDVKMFTNFVLLLQIVGALLYVGGPYHVCFPIIGRFIAGTGDVFIGACGSEVVRLYKESDSTRALWCLASCYSVGTILGPVIPLLFTNIEFSIGTLRINQYNFIGVVMASCFLVTMLSANLLIHDCSKEFDLKAHLQETDETDTSGRISSNSDVSIPEHIQKPPSALVSIRTLLFNCDVLLLFASTFICMYSMFSADVLVPLIFVILLKETLASLALFYIVCGIVYALLLFFLSRCVTNESLFMLMVVCLEGALIMFLTLAIIAFKERNPLLDFVLVLFFGFTWLLTTCTEEVIIKAILARKVQSNVQSFTEALRNGVSSIAAVLGAVSTPLLLPVIGWWALVMSGVISVLIVFYVVRRKSLLRADIIDIHVYKSISQYEFSFEG